MTRNFLLTFNKLACRHHHNVWRQNQYWLPDSRLTPHEMLSLLDLDNDWMMTDWSWLDDDDWLQWMMILLLCPDLSQKNIWEPILWLCVVSRCSIRFLHIQLKTTLQSYWTRPTTRQRVCFIQMYLEIKLLWSCWLYFTTMSCLSQIVPAGRPVRHKPLITSRIGAWIVRQNEACVSYPINQIFIILKVCCEKLL